MNIGIVTLHRVLNYGSALQAYALEKYLQRFDCHNVEIIDYIYPNKYHKVKQGVVKKLRGIVRITREYIFRKKRRKHSRFEKFYKNFLVLTPQKYTDIEQIHNDPPICDIYLTGSDQVWNVETLKNDPVLYCTFAPKNSKKNAYGASFTIKELPEQYRESIRNRLNEYSYIGVREYSSLKILKDLRLEPHIKSLCTCDPTLLLSSNDYSELANHSKVKIKGKYILVYFLNYAFNPEPAISIVTDLVTKYYRIPVICIDNPKFKYKGNYKNLNGIGPCEFVYLFQNAEYIITSSFHGTMFSIINRKPFATILPNKEHKDRRIRDVLNLLGLNRNGIESSNEEPFVLFDNPFSEDVIKKLDLYINESKLFLKESIFS